MSPNINGNSFLSLAVGQFNEFYCFMILAHGLVVLFAKIKLFEGIQLRNQSQKGHFLIFGKF